MSASGTTPEHPGERRRARLTRFVASYSDFAIALLVTAVGIYVFSVVDIRATSGTGLSFVRNIELRSLDARFEMRGPRAHDPRIQIVDIDEKTLQKVGSFPIARSYYGRLIDKLSEGGATVVAFDVDFPTPEKNSAVEALKKLESKVAGSASPELVEQIRQIQRTSDNDAILAKSMRKANNVVLGHLFLDQSRAQGVASEDVDAYFVILWDHPFPQVRPLANAGNFDLAKAWSQHGYVAIGVEPNIKLLAESAKSFGFFDESPDVDGTIRAGMLIIRYQDQDFYPSLALETVRRFEDIKGEEIIGWMAPNGLERIELGRHHFNTLPDGTALINYRGPYNTFKHYPMIDVIDGTVPAETFRGNIVLLGATAKAVGDIRHIPYPEDASQSYAGVEIQATIMDNLLHSDETGRGFLSRGFREKAIDLAFIVLFGLGLGFLFAKLKPAMATACAVLALAVYGFILYAAFANWGMWLSFTVPTATLLLTYAGIIAYRVIFEERQKHKIHKSFAHYIAPEIISLIDKNPGLLRPGGETQNLTVMFSDIRSFTTISETMTADELVLLLNEYLGEMTDILMKNWGTLDKFIGDAIMGFWGSPLPQEDHAERACACALEMHARLHELNRKWENQGRKQLHIGVGLNSGPVCVGNMGSKQRLAWTVMGDNVNLASRLESLTKQYAVPTLISEKTYKLVAHRFVCRELDLIRVKGKLQPVAIYELMAKQEDAEKCADRLARFEQARRCYQEQHWSEAIEKFEDMLHHYPDDGPAHLLLRRCYEFRTELPAADWDGVYVMKNK